MSVIVNQFILYNKNILNSPFQPNCYRMLLFVMYFFEARIFVSLNGGIEDGGTECAMAVGSVIHKFMS